MKKVLGGNYNGKSSLEPFILFAETIMIEVEACATSKGVPIAAAKASLMAGFLAAHAYCAQDPMYLSRSTMSASGSFQRQNGEGIESTEFGRLAKQLDSSGCLVAVTSGGERDATGTWAGTRYTEQQDHEDWG